MQFTNLQVLTVDIGKLDKSGDEFLRCFLLLARVHLHFMSQTGRVPILVSERPLVVH